MSIYGSTFSVGDPDDPDEKPGIVLIRDNGENHWPSLNRNRRGCLSGAEIPSWCVPGHEDDYDGGYQEPGTWYRLGGCSWREELGWEKLWVDQEYLLDEDAVRALRDDLTRWLEKPKTHALEIEGGTS